MSVVRDFSPDVSHSTMLYRMALLVLMILTTVLCYALLVISKRQEAMLEELLKRSGSMQETSVLINPETRSQVGRVRAWKRKLDGTSG
jgi:hypothetical protein